MELDDIDRELIGLLVEDARISYRELGEKVALSANATAERVRRLRATGVISGFHAAVNPLAAGRSLVALIDVRLSAPQEAPRFERLVKGIDSITDASHLTGRFDYHLRLACRDTSEVDSIIRRMKTEGGVVQTDTRIALRTVVRRSV